MRNQQPKRITHKPATILHDALYAYLGTTMLEDSTHFVPTSIMPSWQPFTAMPPIAINKVANGVVHPTTKESITKYQKLVNETLLRDIWMTAMCKELGRLAQGYGEVKGTDTIHFMSLNEIEFF